MEGKLLWVVVISEVGQCGPLCHNEPLKGPLAKVLIKRLFVYWKIGSRAVVGGSDRDLLGRPLELWHSYKYILPPAADYHELCLHLFPCLPML